MAVSKLIKTIYSWSRDDQEGSKYRGFPLSLAEYFSLPPPLPLFITKIMCTIMGAQDMQQLTIHTTYLTYIHTLHVRKAFWYRLNEYQTVSRLRRILLLRSLTVIRILLKLNKYAFNPPIPIKRKLIDAFFFFFKFITGSSFVPNFKILGQSECEYPIGYTPKIYRTLLIDLEPWSLTSRKVLQHMQRKQSEKH